MKILAIDPGTRLGWAWVNGNTRLSGTQDFSLVRGDSPGMRYVRLIGWLNNLVRDLGKPDLIFHEQPHHRGGAATAVLAGIVGHLQAWAVEHECEISAVHSGTLKKHATGRGNANKEEMRKAAEGRWPEVEFEDDNHIDALWLLDMAEKRYCPEGK